MKEYLVGAANFHATYTAGRFIANSPQEAIEKAKEDYKKSGIGRALKDISSFRFFIMTEEE